MTCRYLVSGAPERGSIIAFADPDGEAQAPEGLRERFEDQWRVIVCESFTAANSSAALAERRGFSPELVGSKDSLEEHPGSQGASDSFGEDAPKPIPEDEAAACRFVMERLLNAPVGAAILYGIGQGARLARAVARELPQCVLALVLDEAPESGAPGGEGPGAAMPAHEALANAGEARSPGAFNTGHTQGSTPTPGATTRAIPLLTGRDIPCLIGETAHDLEAVAAFLEEACPAFPLARPYYESEQALKAFADPEMGRREYRESREFTARNFTAPQLPEGFSLAVEDFNGIECRVMGYEERESSLVFFVVHGGGYMLGEARYEDPRNIDLITDFSSALLADKSCGVITISPEYRLAPEHPFPAGRDDVLTALRETMRRHRGAPLFLMGDSAGAGLVYQALQALEDEELARVSGVLALEPCLNPLLVSASSYDYRDAPVWPRPTAAISWGHYQAGGAQPWQVCPPMGRDRRPFPPIYVAVNTADLLRDEAVSWAWDLVRSGVAVDLHSFAGTVHGWTTVPPTKTWERMKDTIRSFITTCLESANAHAEHRAGESSCPAEQHR
ncbi:putative heroin esterase, chain A [Schaalia cardiffensis F0333]|uniref:Putative heroin esterase, chain A n=1 Tax=Schaalia cardiffensis F0333 TaxID=888050 RepID=N6X3I1_9ACTO|nr:alpha/beta hydrolase fold domain-containing protein [Schaalia cardiffensis]ENO18007.1 putative heroin esterase, chain A [Schaalia cardiffensis F0333]